MLAVILHAIAAKIMMLNLYIAAIIVMEDVKIAIPARVEIAFALDVKTAITVKKKILKIYAQAAILAVKIVMIVKAVMDAMIVILVKAMILNISAYLVMIVVKTVIIAKSHAKIAVKAVKTIAK